MVKTFAGPSQVHVNCVTISSDDKYLFSGSDDCHIIQWQISDGSIKAKFEGHSDCVRSIFISADSRFLVSGGNDNKVIIFDVESAVAIR